jgi:pimeloyl-ACP methyl ester carboxylesterase
VFSFQHPVAKPAIHLLLAWRVHFRKRQDALLFIRENIMYVISSWPKRLATFVTAHAFAASVNNPDHVAITIHKYRWRIGLADGERRYDDLEKRLAAVPIIAAPAITMEGDSKGAAHPDSAAYRNKFSGKYDYRLITGGVGHNLPQEAPQAFAQAIVDVDGFSR